MPVFQSGSVSPKGCTSEAAFYECYPEHAVPATWQHRTGRYTSGRPCTIACGSSLAHARSSIMPFAPGKRQHRKPRAARAVPPPTSQPVDMRLHSDLLAKVRVADEPVQAGMKAVHEKVLACKEEKGARSSTQSEMLLACRVWPRQQLKQHRSRSDHRIAGRQSGPRLGRVLGGQRTVSRST